MSAASATPGTIRPETGSQKYLALAAMLFAVSMTFIDQTIVAIAAPDIEKELGLSPEGLQWVINGYLLALAALFALGGRLADIFGHKKMVLVGTVIFAVASGLCGLTPVGAYSEAWIIFWRIVQGAGAAIMFPAALAVVVSAFPLKERGRALAVFFAVSGALTAVGPIAGGYLTEWTWRAIFWVNIPVAIIAVILTIMAKENTVPKREKIDWRGAVLIVGGMGLSVLGFQQASAWGWGDPKTITCIVLGLVILYIFVRVELKTEVPLIKMRIFKDRAFAVDNGVLFFSMMAFIPVFFFLSMYAQICLGYSAQNAGIFIMWFFIGFVVTAQIGGSILDHVGAKLPVILGCAIGTVGFALWAWKTTELSSSAIVPFIVMSGAGIGFLLGPASTDAVNRSIDASYGEVTGISQTVRNYGSSVGFALLGTLFITQAGSNILKTMINAGVPESQAQAIAASITRGNYQAPSGGSGSATDAVAQHITAQIPLDFAKSIQLVLYGMAIAMAIAFVVSLLHPGGKVELTDSSDGAAGVAAGTAPNTAAGAVAIGAATPPENMWKGIAKRVLTFAIIFAIIYAIVWFFSR